MYEIMLVVFIIISLVIMILSLYKYLKLKQKSEEIIKKDIEKLRELKHNEYNEIYKEYTNKINILEKEFKEKQEIYNKSIEQTKYIIQEEENKKDLIIKQKQKIIDKELNEYKIEKEIELDKDYFDKINELDEKLKEYNDETNLKIYEAQESLNNILKELEDYSRRQAVVKKTILREKKLKEKENFYRLNISENDIEDIEILKTIEYKLKNKEALNKLIFDVYISKPMKEMIKRVLGGRTPSGIYKITYIPTGEAYIGKSTNIKTRWENHCKATWGLGTISHSSLHTKMARDGIWNFTFELLEEVEKDKLSEREKYWIDFYDTKNYGLNEKRGG